MRRKTTNVFKVGGKVKIGFMELTCVEESSYGPDKDYPLNEPGCWILKSAKGALYAFLPYQGLFKI